jgi:hypothetical protein
VLCFCVSAGEAREVVAFRENTDWLWLSAFCNYSKCLKCVAGIALVIIIVDCCLRGSKISFSSLLRIFLFPPCPDRVWSAPQCMPGAPSRGVKLNNHHCLMPRIRTDGAVSHTYLCLDGYFIQSFTFLYISIPQSSNKF